MQQRPRPRVGELVRFALGVEELLGDLTGHCDGYDARLPARERIRGERVSNPYVVVIADVRAELVVSRRTPKLIEQLFRTRYRAIQNDDVAIYHVAREPGVRAKVSLDTALEDPDFIANLFCADDTIKQIVADSGDPLIDMVPAQPEIGPYVGNALAPMEVLRIAIDEDHDLLLLVVPDAEAVELVNVQLAADLVGWKLHVLRESDHARDGWDARPVVEASPRATAPRPPTLLP
jgi:transcription termination/antitermination protein NusA